MYKLGEFMHFQRNCEVVEIIKYLIDEYSSTYVTVIEVSEPHTVYVGRGSYALCRLIRH